MDLYAPDPRPASARRQPAPRVDWRELYVGMGERVFRMLHRMTGDPALAEDLTHDAFVRVHEARDQYDGRGPVAAWVFRIAANLARDELRRRTRRADALSAYPGRDGQTAPVDSDLRVSLQDALAELGPGYRHVVLLHDVDGYTHAEIAEMLGIREGTSRVRLTRARVLLRAALSAGSER